MNLQFFGKGTSAHFKRGVKFYKFCVCVCVCVCVYVCVCLCVCEVGVLVKKEWDQYSRRDLIPRRTLCIKQYWRSDIFRKLLANNTTHFSRIYIKQYWHFHRVLYKLNYSKKFFKVYIILTSESYCRLTLTFSDQISHKIHTFSGLFRAITKQY